MNQELALFKALSEAIADREANTVLYTAYEDGDVGTIELEDRETLKCLFWMAVDLKRYKIDLHVNTRADGSSWIEDMPEERFGKTQAHEIWWSKYDGSHNLWTNVVDLFNQLKSAHFNYERAAEHVKGTHHTDRTFAGPLTIMSWPGDKGHIDKSQSGEITIWRVNDQFGGHWRRGEEEKELTLQSGLRKIWVELLETVPIKHAAPQPKVITLNSYSRNEVFHGTPLTPSNAELLAEWCGGTLSVATRKEKDGRSAQIQLTVPNVNGNKKAYCYIDGCTLPAGDHHTSEELIGNGVVRSSDVVGRIDGKFDVINHNLIDELYHIEEGKAIEVEVK